MFRRRHHLGLRRTRCRRQDHHVGRRRRFRRHRWLGCRRWHVGASTPHIGSGYLGGGTAESGTRTVKTLSTVFAGSADHTRNADGLINMDATDNADDSTIAHNRCDSGTTGKDGAAEELGASVGAPTTGASIRPADAIPVGGAATFEVSSAPEQPRRSRRPDDASAFARR